MFAVVLMKFTSLEWLGGSKLFPWEFNQKRKEKHIVCFVVKERNKAFGRSWKRLDEKRDLGLFVEEGNGLENQKGWRFREAGGNCWNRVLEGMGEKGPRTQREAGHLNRLQNVSNFDTGEKEKEGVNKVLVYWTEIEVVTVGEPLLCLWSHQ